MENKPTEADELEAADVWVDGDVTPLDWNELDSGEDAFLNGLESDPASGFNPASTRQILLPPQFPELC